LDWKGLPGTNTNLLGPFASYEENVELLIWPNAAISSLADIELPI